MRHTMPKRAIFALLVAILAATGLSACSSSPSETNIESAIFELEGRGFTEPRWDTSRRTYTVGVGDCRFPAVGTEHRGWAVVIPSEEGGKYIDANLELLRPEESISACFD